MLFFVGALTAGKYHVKQNIPEVVRGCAGRYNEKVSLMKNNMWFEWVKLTYFYIGVRGLVWKLW
jgi:hypothetical protein